MDMFKSYRSECLGMKLTVVCTYTCMYLYMYMYLDVLWLEENNSRTMDKEDDKQWTTLLSPATYGVA